MRSGGLGPSVRSHVDGFVYASKLNEEEDTLHIMTFNDKHTNCRPAYQNSYVSSSWLAKRYVDSIRSNPGWPLQDFREQVKKDHQVSVSKTKVFRAKRKAQQMIDGGFTEQYAQLWNYCAEIKRVMPDSTVFLHKDPHFPDEDRFKRFYCCLGPLKKGFYEGCRLFIGLDGCFLKGPYGGQLLAAVGVDANNGMYPLAWAVVEKECKSSWLWFLQCLCHDIDQNKDWITMSDQQKGLVLAIQQIFPQREQRFCVRHHHSNFRKEHKGKKLKDLFWNCARASTIQRFERCMQELKNAKTSAHTWVVDSVSPAHWSRSHFSTHSKCDLLINNHCEIFNSFILEARDKPIISLMERIRNLMMVRIRKNRDKMRKHPGVICPRIELKLKEIVKESNNFVCEWSGGSEYQINGPYVQYTVDMVNRTCSCRKWELSGIPCMHAASAILYNANEVENYMHECYSTATYLKTYKHVIKPLNGVDMWPQSTNKPLVPPFVETQPGRKKKGRNKSQDEKKTGKLGKQRVEMHCSRCGQGGHNLRKCTGIGVASAPTSMGRGRGRASGRGRGRGRGAAAAAATNSTGAANMQGRRPSQGFNPPRAGNASQNQSSRRSSVSNVNS